MGHRASTSGFTLLEMIIVIAVIAGLLAGGMPILSAVRRRADVSATRSMVTAITAAMAGFQTKAWVVPVQVGTTWEQRRYRMWDCDGDHLLDRNPNREPPSPLVTALSDSGYRGFYEMVQPTISKRLVRDGRIIDPWGTPLRIAYADEGFYDASKSIFGTVGLGVWSAGPDRRDVVSTPAPLPPPALPGPPDTTSGARADDIHSWGSGNE